MKGDRVVLARRENSMIKYRWTGAEPAGLSDIEVAEELGARWEGNDLVTYDVEGFEEAYQFHLDDDYMIDND